MLIFLKIFNISQLNFFIIIFRFLTFSLLMMRNLELCYEDFNLLIKLLENSFKYFYLKTMTFIKFLLVNSSD